MHSYDTIYDTHKSVGRQRGGQVYEAQKLSGADDRT